MASQFLDLVCSVHIVTITTGANYTIFLDLVCSDYEVTITTGVTCSFIISSKNCLHISVPSMFWIWEYICRQNSNQIHIINLYFMPFVCGRMGLFRELWVVFMSRFCLWESHCIRFKYLVPNNSWYSGLALTFGIRSKAWTVDEIRRFKVFQK